MRSGIALASLLIVSGLWLAASRAHTRAQTPITPPRESSAKEAKLGESVPRTGDEIEVCGRLFHTTTRVVLWSDPGGFDAYRVERRYAPFEESDWESTHAKVKAIRAPARFGLRKLPLEPEEKERVRGGSWDLPLLRKHIDQFVIHFDARGTSRGCFEVLQDMRGLSVHFMLDLDGTIYQTLDLKEGAWHATIVNPRSIGIEVANIGAYAPASEYTWGKWYEREPDGRMRVKVPKRDVGLRGEGFIARPIRDKLIVGEVQGKTLEQYDFTPEQYEALARLTATLCTIFPRIALDYPRGSDGKLIPHKLSEDAYKSYHGILGHYHVQLNKVDPGPAFQWDRLMKRTKELTPK